MHFSTMAAWLEPAKVQYAGSAQLMDQIDGVNFTPEQRSLLRECADPVFREGLRDVMVNQQFRRDLWVRGSRRLSPQEQREALAAVRLVLVVSPRDVPRKVSTPLGPATLNARVLEQLLDIMGAHRVWTLGELERQLAPRGVAYANLVEMVFLLVGAGSIHPAQDEAAIEAARPATQRLNAHLTDAVRLSAEVPWLASPVTGGGVSVGRIHGLFLGALRSVRAEADRLGESAWRSLEAVGERMVKDGKRLESPAENLTELTRLAREFIEFRLPVLRALQIAPEA
jgi:hypothetical protein